MGGGGIEGGGVEFVGRSRDPLGVLVGGDRGRGGGWNLCRAVKGSLGSIGGGGGRGRGVEFV